ncbi:homocysteine S-methyltransferase [Streptococcus sp. DD12]|uniref:homocysteine S-methyltransferase n=1 Tax=Streptococcus sp. DD12 TaxID=1777880 RepID=UPI0007918D9D|nr:homocysteine S-methyltransferase [Streptococcus sp. DD12]KXT76684.1 Homocysteine S-methyltransferase [Streptococcus sp. DD12]
MNRFESVLKEGRPLILHGALGTELEARGYDVSGSLWSAQYISKQPDVIRQIHEDYILAGADVVTTSSYQASLQGLLDAGQSEEEAQATIRKSVQLAKEAIDRVWQYLPESQKTSRILPLISGDVGPYAAYLADGSEYTGAYDLSATDFKDFHRPRITWLLEEGVDLLALETMPNLAEIKALSDLLEQEFPESRAYLSVTTQDGFHLSDGHELAEVAQLVEDSQQILALGINCSQPDHLSNGLEQLAQSSSKPLVAYPNSGESYDGATQSWQKGHLSSVTLAQQVTDWQANGAQIVGGCCRTRPADIAALSEKLSGQLKTFSGK